MKTAKDYYERRQICRQLNVPVIGKHIKDIIRDRATAEELKLISDQKLNAMIGKEIYSLRSIKEKYCLSWTEMRAIAMNWK